ncbi:unnamed protein product [Allacma fusca]|uniref:Uncharacterized protein n=1 Tax=Allacma fusca TaxID=39272 RepID=A0A8J2PYL0_9HEXA|nr:unnamed protein product [Allacma fusca]
MIFLANYPTIANFSGRFDVVSRDITFSVDNIGGGQIIDHFETAKFMFDDFLPVNLAKVINMKGVLHRIAMLTVVVLFDVVFAYDKDGYRRYV